MNSDRVVEYRGCEGLVFAKILTDNNEAEGGYTTDAVKVLAPVAEISKNVEVSRTSKWYDNRAAMVMTSEGEDTVSLTIAIPEDEVLAAVNGRVYDETLKMYIECPIVTDYYALGYKLKDTDGVERYVWRHKGYFMPPDETSATEDDGTDGNNMSLEYHGIYTLHKFENGGGSGKPSPIKSFAMRTDSGKDLSTFFDTVSSPDTVFNAAT